MHRLVTATLDEAGPLPALVFCEGTDGLLRLPVNALPMAYGGAAQFNLSNAAHAALALIGLGLSTEDIEAGLRSFEPGPDMTPGRMNLFTQLPFTVLMDFAHNPDGMRQVAAFVDAYPVSGRRLVAFAGSPGRPERTHRELSRALAGHFDHYFCKEYKMPPGKAGIVAAPALRDELLKQGVAPEQVTVTHHGPEVIARIFDACRPGDLLVMLMGHVEQHELPGYIEDHARRLAG